MPSLHSIPLIFKRSFVGGNHLRYCTKLCWRCKWIDAAKMRSYWETSREVGLIGVRDRVVPNKGSRHLTFCAFAVCRLPFQREEDIFPLLRKRGNVSTFSQLVPTIVPTISSFWLLVFYCYASFIILLLHVPFVKQSFEFERKTIITSLFILSSYSEWRPRPLVEYHAYFA